MPRTRNVAHANSTSRIRARASVRASSSRRDVLGAHDSLFSDENPIAQDVLLG